MASRMVAAAARGAVRRAAPSVRAAALGERAPAARLATLGASPARVHDARCLRGIASLAVTATAQQVASAFAESDALPCDWTAGPLVLGAFTDAFDAESGSIHDEQMRVLDGRLGGAVGAVCAEESFTGKEGAVCTVRPVSSGGEGSALPLLVLVGLGDPGSRAADDNAVWTQFGRQAARAVPDGRYAKVGVAVAGGQGRSTSAGALRALFSSLLAHAAPTDQFKSKPAQPLVAAEDRVYSALGFGSSSALGSRMDDARHLAHGVRLAKDLVNAPANHATPSALAEVARRLAAEHPDCLQVRVLEADECAAYGEHGMGLFLGVAKGSAEAPKFIHLTYRGADSKESAGGRRRKVALVGKGVTFDSGGVNLKVGPSSMIELMKFDMGGSAAVLGAAKALAGLKPEGVEVHALLACCENMVDAGALRPGDVLVASDGTSVEVNNTDAEGRLTLADALLYAQQEARCDELVTVATLTGACIVALGEGMAGLLANHDAAATRAAAAARAAGEPAWRLPLHRPYRSGLDSLVADMKNTGPAPAGTITSALFLDHFVGNDKQWAHLDIAGPVWEKKTGATGFGVASLVSFCTSCDHEDYGTLSRGK